MISIQPDHTGKISTQEYEKSLETMYVNFVEEDWRMQG